MRLRRRLYHALDLDAWEGVGVSRLNRVLLLILFVSIVVTVLDTEPSLDRYDPWFRAANWVFGCVFFAEFVLRLWVKWENPRYPGRYGPLRHLVKWYSIIDFVALVALWLELTTGLGAAWPLMLRLARFLRIFSLTKSSAIGAAIRELWTALSARSAELGLSVGLALLVLLISATALYMAERTVQPEAFGSIPRAMWWAMATLTTVGYGDVYPVTPLGKFAASLAALTAVAIVAMPAGIMAATFSDAFQKARERREELLEKLEEEERKPD